MVNLATQAEHIGNEDCNDKTNSMFASEFCN